MYKEGKFLSFYQKTFWIQVCHFIRQDELIAVLNHCNIKMRHRGNHSNHLSVCFSTKQKLISSIWVMWKYSIHSMLMTDCTNVLLGPKFSPYQNFVVSPLYFSSRRQTGFRPSRRLCPGTVWFPAMFRLVRQVELSPLLAVTPPVIQLRSRQTSLNYRVTTSITELMTVTATTKDNDLA